MTAASSARATAEGATSANIAGTSVALGEAVCKKLLRDLQARRQEQGARGTTAPVEPGELLVPVVGSGPRGTLTAAEAAEAGAELLLALADAGCSPAGVAAVRRAARLPEPTSGTTDPTGLECLGLLAGRVPDGAAIEATLRPLATGTVVPPELELPAEDEDAFVVAARAWLTWFDTIHPSPAVDTWDSERLEHRIALAAAPPTGAPFTLSAPC